MRTWLWVLGVCAWVGCGSPQDGGERGGRPDGGRPGSDADAAADECEPCGEHASCIGGECACDEGFERDGASCEDIDECAGDNDCDENATCTNTAGGYTCACKAGFTGDGETCAAAGCSDLICDPNATCSDGADGGCACGAGFEGDGEGCGDVNECETASAFSCADDGECVNTFGGYTCECAPTFGGDGKTSCRPLCEIAAGDRDVCAAQGVCRIDRDAAVCDACAPGFTGTGKACTANAAGCGAACDGAGGDDEAHAVCDGEGGCACAPGYEGTPGSCEDIDECAAANACGANARCINTEGGFFCACNAGYEKNGSGACVDKNECEAATSPCHPNATCTNTTGGFECACKAGYTGNGAVCRDTNECEAGGACAEHATCKNTAGSFQCSCQKPFTGDPSACYCDLSGTWAMRQDVDTCWEDLHFPGTTGDANRLIAAGQMEATVWELHKLRYDGEVIRVEKKGCSSDNAPDLKSPFFSETYSSYIPDKLFDQLGFFPGNDIEEAGIVPGRMFTTRDEAAVIGIDLGDDPVGAPWPAVNDDVNAPGGAAPAWDDTDEDGMPGVTVWPRLPTQTPDSGTGKYSYLPVTPSGTTIAARAGCVSVAARVVTRLEVDVESCSRMVGTLIDVKSEGRVHACTRIPNEDANKNGRLDSGEDTNGNGLLDELQPITCNADDWNEMTMCIAEDLDRLDSDQNQAQTTRTTFELVRIGDVNDDVTCLDVRDRLPAFERGTPTITCRD